MDADDFLAHYGIKGMRWGVRRSKRGGTPEQKKAGTKKLARNMTVGTGAAVALGIAATSAVLSRRGMVSVGSANRFANDKAARILVDHGSGFTRSNIELDVLMNSARQVREGTSNWDFYKLR